MVAVLRGDGGNLGRGVPRRPESEPRSPIRHLKHRSYTTSSSNFARPSARGRLSIFPATLIVDRPSFLLPKQQPTKAGFVPSQRRSFETEAEFHPIADEALETIQDAIDTAFEKVTDPAPIEYELTVASGVLTLTMPPHGTWVINKQTPNKQLWWSSPLSGPKRFEYDEQYSVWFSTKDGLSLGPFLVQELRHFHPELEEFEIDV